MDHRVSLREAAQQALEALEAGDWYINQLELIMYFDDDTGTHEERAKVQAAITALRAALAQEQAEPQYWGVFEGCNLGDFFTVRQMAVEMAYYKGSHATVGPLYTAPPQRTPLTEEEIADAANSVRWSEQYHVDFARAVERAHGITEPEDKGG